MDDCLIIGGGAVGLSLAYELAGHGLRVQLVDAGAPGHEASWAGAGILPPASERSAQPLEQLAALSNRLHREWSAALRQSTGIDNGLRRCGGIYLARDEAAARQLMAAAAAWRAGGIEAVSVDPDALRNVEPALTPTPPPRATWLLPDEHQLRNPWHLRALEAGCVERGVRITPHAGAEDFVIRGERIERVRTTAGEIAAGAVCLTSGAWSAGLAARWGVTTSIRPIRGQIVLLRTAVPQMSHIVSEGLRYLVPRSDGRLLVGSTEEDVGFDRRTTAGGTVELLNLALSLAPRLAGAQVERCWAGLRPATADRLPYIGRVPTLSNAYLAAGHFRSGLQLSTGTAVVLGELLRGQSPSVNLTSFRVDRA